MNISRLTQLSVEAVDESRVRSTGVGGEVPKVDLPELLRILNRRKSVMLATVLVVMAMGGIILFSVTPIYTAEAFVEINPRQANVVDFQAVLSGLTTDVGTIETEIRIIKSRTIAERSISRLGLNKDPEFNPALRAKGVSSWLDGIGSWIIRSSGSGDRQEAIGENLSGEAGLVRKSVLYLSNFLISNKETGMTNQQLTQWEKDRVTDTFLEHLSAEPEGQSRVIRVSFKSTNPETAAAAANAVVDFYIVSQLEQKYDAAKRATIWLNKRVADLREEVEKREQAVEQFRSEAGLLQGGQNVPLTDEQVSELNAQYVREVARLAEAQARLQQVNNLQDSKEGVGSALEVLQSPLIQDLRREEARMQRQIAELSEEYGRRHPALINAHAELRDLRAKIQLEVDRVVQGLRNEVAIVRARAATLASSLEQAKKTVGKTNQSEVKLRSYEREASAARTLLENLLQRTKETVSQETFQQADANVVSVAARPEKPSFPKISIFLPLTFFTAVMLGILLIAVLEKMDLGFRSSEQVKSLTGRRSLGLLPSISKLTAMGKAPHHYVMENPGSAYSEAIRNLYTNVLLSDEVDRPKVILLASSMPCEGKTTLAISMARLFAMAGHRTIVVDCDLRWPRVHKEMKLDPGLGLSNCLAEGKKINDVIHKDPLSTAHVLQAGTDVQLSPEEFSSHSMQTLLRNLKHNYDIVILDSPPILAVSDSLFLSQLADTTIFLIRWAKTKRAAANLALERLVEAQSDVAGIALSMVDAKSHAQYGYGDSGSYHGTLKKYYTS